MRRLLIPSLAGLILVAGCGAPPAVAPQTPFAVEHRHGGHRLATKLGLSDEQKAQMKAIVRKYMCGSDTTASPSKEAVKTALLASTFDKAAFSSAYNTMLDDREARIDRKVAMLAELRAVLTPEQRTKFAELKRAKKSGKSHGMHHHMRKMEKLLKDLNLTAEQKQAFSDLKDALAEGRDARKANREARNTAMADFAVSGDTAALKTALLAIKPVVPVDAIATALGSLTPEQRQKLVDKMEAKKAKWCAPPEDTSKTKSSLEEESASGSCAKQDESVASEGSERSEISAVEPSSETSAESRNTMKLESIDSED